MIEEFDNLYSSGLNCRDNNQVKQSKIFFERAIEIIKEIDENSNLSYLVHQTYGQCLNEIKKYEKSKKMFEKCIFILNLDSNRFLPHLSSSLRACYSSLGESLVGLKLFNVAEDVLYRSLNSGFEDNILSGCDYYNLAKIQANKSKKYSYKKNK